MAVLRELLDAGYAVTAPVREPERLEASFGAGSSRLSVVRADLVEPEAAAAMVEGVEDLSAVVNLVGGFSAPGKVHEMAPEDFERMLRLNLRPGFLLARAAMPRLVAGGGGAYVGVSARPVSAATSSSRA